MKFLNVLKSFKLNLAEGVIRDFEAGLHEVEDEVAAHWYVVANSEPLTTKQAKAIKANEGAVVSDDVNGGDLADDTQDSAAGDAPPNDTTDTPPAS